MRGACRLLELKFSSGVESTIQLRIEVDQSSVVFPPRQRGLPEMCAWLLPSENSITAVEPPRGIEAVEKTQLAPFPRALKGIRGPDPKIRNQEFCAQHSRRRCSLFVDTWCCIMLGRQYVQKMWQNFKNEKYPISFSTSNFSFTHCGRRPQ